MRSLWSAVTRLRTAAAESLAAQPPPPPPRDATAAREDVLEHGLSAERALALGNALEAEGRLLEAVDALTDANRLRRDTDVERRLVRLRRAAFTQLDRSLSPPSWPPEVPEDRPGQAEGPPIISAAELTPGILRNGIRRHGALLVRGLVPLERVVRMRRAIDAAFHAQEAAAIGWFTPETRAWCDLLEDVPNGDDRRLWTRVAQAVLVADSPRAFFEFMDTIRDTGVERLLTAYLGERPTLAMEKCTLRRIGAGDWKVRYANWHQDGSFLGKGIRTVDAWFSLCKSGRDAPGMEIVPRRLDRLLPTGEHGAFYDWCVSPETIARELPGMAMWRPDFEEGDVLFFDEMCLHRTVAEEGMTQLRYSIESWFFASSVYPAEWTPLVV